MTVRAKLTAIIALVAAVPLTISATTALSVHQRAFDGKLDELHRQTAEHGARLAEATLGYAGRSLRQLAAQVEWPALSAEEREGALWLVYRQHDDVRVASLLDEHGEGVGASAYRGAAGSGAAGEGGAHPAATVELLRAFATHIPFQRAQLGDAVVGDPYAAAAGEAADLPLAIGVAGPREGARWLVAVGLSLRGLCADIARSTGEMEVLLLDARHRSLCPARGAAALASADPALVALLGTGGVASYRDATGRELRAALAALPERGWTIVAQQPTDSALAASRTIRTHSLVWIAISLLVAVAAGLTLSGGITGPLRTLTDAARALGAGHAGSSSLPAPLLGGRRDELGQLSRAFRQMSEEIEKRDAEIRGWNQELQDRVADRTRELHEAQEQLLRSQRVAAVSSLGAGFAHEINNPLTSVIGITQVMLARARRDPQGDSAQLLETIEAEAQRIRRTVSTLQAVSEGYGGQGRTELVVAELVDGVLRRLQARLDQAGVAVERRYAPDLPTILGSEAELAEALSQIVKNGVAAMRASGALTITTSTVEGKLVKIAVVDSGCGIAPEHLEKIFDPFFTTKGRFQGEGLGLTVAHRIVEDHHGKIRAASALGKGTTMTITLPAARRGAHLV